jgi:hypothetical protein
MPSIDGGDQCSKEYAPHMWIGDNFIHNSGLKLKVGEWWYRAGRLHDESLVAERWKGSEYKGLGGVQTDHEPVSAELIPPELVEKMKSVSRARQHALQRFAEKLANS